MMRSLLLLSCAIAWAISATSPAAADDAAKSDNVLLADSFEQGDAAPDGWEQGAPVAGVEFVYDRGAASAGERSLGLRKSANQYFPFTGWTRTFDHASDKAFLRVDAKVKAAKMTKAVIDVQFLDANGEWLQHEWAAYIGEEPPRNRPASHNWKDYGGVVAIPTSAKRIAISLQVYGPGKVWFDEVAARYVDSADAPRAENKEAPPEKSKPAEAPETDDAAAAPLAEPIEVRTAGGAEARYLLIPASAAPAAGARGRPLLLVLPGGDGSIDFHPFVRRIHEQALLGEFVVAQPLAPPRIVWPTAFTPSVQPTTEQAIAAIVADVAERTEIDREHVYALAWSSSGPAVYAALLDAETPLAGALIAMSVYKTNQLPSLDRAAGRRVYLLHSREDAICPFAMAEAAQRELAAHGAETTLVEYAGGHGWHGPVYDNIRAGVDWLRRPH